MIAVDCRSPDGAANGIGVLGEQEHLEYSPRPTPHSLGWFRSFWTASVTPRPLAWFRIGLASVLLAQALSLIGNLEALYGRRGVVDESVRWVNPPPGVPNVQWLDRELSQIGVPASSAVPLVFAIYVGSLLGLLLGYRTRLA